MTDEGSSDAQATAVVAVVRLATDETTAEPIIAATPGARLGRYLVIEELGRGGMGLVLRAYDPKLQREVALKRLHSRALDESAQARLIREARAMAKLNHPNVVAVYDVDLADDDVVVAMEYVPGMTLRQWLKAEPRSWKAIVAAFIAAGQGLAAAHASDLLHRDFKLDNVLVGNDARVRVTDFGLARTTSARSGDSDDAASLDDVIHGDDGISVELTQAGVVMGTPPYMAPEQHEGRQLDARTDQYALCVALWRALTNDWPFEGRGRQLLEAKRAGAPKWPTDVPVTPHIADAIRRGLSPHPDDRWPTLHALLGELARDPSRTRVRLLGIGVLAVLAAGAWGVQRFERARTLAACAAEGEAIADTWNDARADAIGSAFTATGLSYAPDTWRRSARRLAAYADAWATARTQVCEREGVEQTLGAELAMQSRSCLDERRDELDALLGELERPDAVVVQRTALASAALPVLSECTDESRLRQRGEPPADPELRARVAELRTRLAEVSAARATARFETALRLAQAVQKDARELAWPPLLSEANGAVGGAHDQLGNYDDAVRSLQDAFFEAGAAGRDELALRAGTSLVFVLGGRLAQYDEAVQWGRLSQMITKRLALDEDDLRTAAVLAYLAIVEYRRGDYARAIELHERALAIRENGLGPDHLHVAQSLNNLAIVHQATGAYEEAATLYQRALAIRGEALGPDHPDVAQTLTNLALVRDLTGAYEDAAMLHERALVIFEKALGPDHTDVANTLNNLAIVRRATGAYEEAAALNARALAIRESALGPDHPDVASSLNNLANLRQATGINDEAAELYQRALGIYEKALGPDHPHVAHTLVGLARVALARDLPGDAVPLAERAVTVYEAAHVPDADIAEAMFVLAQALVQAGEPPARAVALAERARDAYHDAGGRHPEVGDQIEQWLRAHAQSR